MTFSLKTVKDVAFTEPHCRGRVYPKPFECPVELPGWRADSAKRYKQSLSEKVVTDTVLRIQGKEIRARFASAYIEFIT